MRKKIITVLMLGLLILGGCTGNQNINDANMADDDGNQNHANEINLNEPVEESTDEEVVVEEPITLEFVDGLGRTVVFDKYPETIISISASTTEILYALGAGDKIIARDAYSEYPAEVLEVEIIGDFFGGLPSEALLAAEADLILAGGIISAEQITTMEELGLTVYYQLDPVDFDGLFTNITDIGELVGAEELAEEVVGGLEARVTAVQETLIDVADQPIVFVELDATDPTSPWTTGSGTFVDYILTTGGGQNAAAELVGAYAQMSTEALIEINPDVILLTDALYGVTPAMVAERAGWEVMAAVKNGKVFPFDPYLFNIPGPRLVDGLEAVALLLHPDLFE
ncbi:MAG: ABC transporter substrate-binding protein [Chloroflexota bacterium]